MSGAIGQVREVVAAARAVAAGAAKSGAITAAVSIVDDAVLGRLRAALDALDAQEATGWAPAERSSAPPGTLVRRLPDGRECEVTPDGSAGVVWYVYEDGAVDKDPLHDGQADTLEGAQRAAEVAAGVRAR